jgi:hypothetical protein
LSLRVRSTTLRPWATAKNSTPAVDDEAFRSSAVVIWLQEHFGLPTDEHILMQLRDLDWPAHAWDWDP